MRDLIRFIGARRCSPTTREAVDRAGRPRRDGASSCAPTSTCRWRTARVTDDTRHHRGRCPPSTTRWSGARRVVLASHLGRPKGKPDPKYSLAPVADAAVERSWIGRCRSLPDCVGPEVEALAPRAQAAARSCCWRTCASTPRRKPTTTDFARRWPALADVYVDDAFAAAHRAHASIAAITALPEARRGRPADAARAGGAGPHPRRRRSARWPPCSAAPRSRTRSRWSSTCSARSTRSLIGGGMAFTFLRALGHGVGQSLVEADRIETARAALEAARRRGVQIVLPVDVVVAAGLDSAAGSHGVRPGDPGRPDGAGHRPGQRRRSSPTALRAARTIVWNGPMGVFEKPRLRRRHLGVARAVAGSARVLGDRRRRHDRRGEPGRRGRSDRLHLHRAAAPSSSSSRGGRCRAWRR